MHDSFNLAWKLNLVSRDLAEPSLLATYEAERRKIALDLISFDAAHVRAFAQGDEALARNFDENIRFISGVGAEYAGNVLNWMIPQTSPDATNGNSLSHILTKGSLKPGALLTPPARVTRYIDANPVHLQLDIPLLSQFRIYIFAPDAVTSRPFLHDLCAYLSSQSSLLSRASACAERSYTSQPPPRTAEDAFLLPERYTPVSKLFTYAFVTRTPKAALEIADLPPLLRASRWTVYLDDIMEAPASPSSCTETYLGPEMTGAAGRVAVVNVRPDGYVGSMNVWDASVAGEGEVAGRWVESYYARFLKG